MGLLSIFSRNKQASAKPGKTGRGGKSPARQAPLANTQSPADTADALREVRARARTRLMGATVLLLIGVIGFPLLFETQPRPIPVDLPIEIPARNAPGVVDASSRAAAHASRPATVAASAPTPESVSYDARPSAPAAASAAASQAAAGKSAFASLAAALTPSGVRASDVADKAAYAAPSMGGAASRGAAAKAAAKPEKAERTEKAEKPAPASAATPSTAAASKPALHTSGPVLPPPSPAALLSGGAADKPSDAAAGGGRFVVQVGAFLEDAKVREARGKVEKLGLKTYTQPVDTPTGKRIRVRVGPFADKVAAKIKAEGQQAVVLVL
jgi:DedD protein